MKTETLYGDWDTQDFGGKEVGVTAVRRGFDGNDQVIQLHRNGRRVLELSPEEAARLRDALSQAEGQFR